MQAQGRLEPLLLVRRRGHLDELAHLGPAQAALGEGPVDHGQLQEGLARGQQVPGLAPAHAEAVGGVLGRGPAAAELLQAPGVEVLQVKRDHPVLEAGRGVGQADPLLDLLEGQALLEGEHFGNVLVQRGLRHGVLS